MYKYFIPYSAIALIACCSLASNDPGSAPGALPVGEPAICRYVCELRLFMCLHVHTIVYIVQKYWQGKLSW